MACTTHKTCFTTKKKAFLENSHVLNRFKVVLKPVSIVQETDHRKNKNLFF